MDYELGSAMAGVLEATRPRHSGPAQNAHTIRPAKEPRPDYQRMREAIEGKTKPSEAGDRVREGQ